MGCQISLLDNISRHSTIRQMRMWGKARYSLRGPKGAEMEWNAAQKQIQSRIKVVTDLNSERSTFRFVKSIDSAIRSGLYGYRDERGFTVSIANGNAIHIPWGLLRECLVQLSSHSGYSGTSFRTQFPKQAQDQQEEPAPIFCGCPFVQKSMENCCNYSSPLIHPSTSARFGEFGIKFR